MLGVCFRYSPNKEEAQDVLQDAFVKVFGKMNTYKGSGALEGWIRRIVVNTAIENFRSKKNRFDEDIDAVENEIKSGSSVDEKVNADDILNFIKLLPKGYQMVFNLHAIDGFSHKEIAKQLKISENTSFSQYSRAKALLRKWLDSENRNVMRKVI